ncbi:MAG: hypothetical protein AAGF12_34315 [Myxococcota bacterium]
MLGSEEPETVRVAAELEASGFAVERVNRPLPQARRVLFELMEEHDAAFAIQAHRQEEEIEIWIAERPMDQVVIRAVSLSSQEDPEGVAALLSVEHLRATLLEVAEAERQATEPDASHEVESVEARSLPEAPSAAPSEPQLEEDAGAVSSPRPRVASAPREERNYSLSLGPGLLFGAGGVSSSPTFLVHARGAVSDYLRAGVVGMIPIGGGEVENQGNRARVQVAALGLEIEGSFPLRFSPVAAVGAAATAVFMDGTATEGFVGLDDTVFTGIFYTRVGARLRILPNLLVRAEFLVGVAWPEVIVSFAEEEVARFGLPFFVPQLQLEVAI